MDIEPQNLNIPLERNEHWGQLLVGVCCAVTVVAAVFNPPFATVFAASSIVGLPVLLLMVSPSSLFERFHVRGDIGRIVFFAAFFGYIELSRRVLLPLVISLIERGLNYFNS